MEPKYRVMIVDDHELFRDGLKFVLSQSEKAEVVGEATNGIEFLETVDQINPDLVLMDISMPEMDGIEATQKILQTNPNLKIVALSMFGDEEYYFRMIHAGVKGFVLKKSGKKDLEKAIEEVMRGESYFSNELLRNIILNITDKRSAKAAHNEDVPLTKREKEILYYICRGYSNNEIAEHLHLSPKTVNGHRTNLLSKTNSKNSINLVMFAIKNNLFQV